MNVESVQLGDLRCHLVDALPSGGGVQLAVVLCHGYGAPGTDLVALGPELLHRTPELAPSTRFYFPEAPHSMDELGLPGGRAWWPLNIEQMAAAAERGDIDSLRNETPDGLEESARKLQSLLAAIVETEAVGPEQIVLGGFSQGSMLATDVALSMTQRPAGLCILSGTLLCEDQWRQRAAGRGPLPVLQSHGRYDPLLPFASAEALRDLLLEAGLPIEFIAFDGQHTIAGETLARLGPFLAGLLPAS